MRKNFLIPLMAAALMPCALSSCAKKAARPSDARERRKELSLFLETPGLSGASSHEPNRVALSF